MGMDDRERYGHGIGGMRWCRLVREQCMKGMWCRERKSGKKNGYCEGLDDVHKGYGMRTDEAYNMSCGFKEMRGVVSSEE